MVLKLGLSWAEVILFRGKQLAESGFNPVSADQVGMLATLMNALVLRDFLEQIGAEVSMVSALPIAGIFPPVDVRFCNERLSQGAIVIFAGGTGNPCVTTDTAASLRSIEIEADVLLKATQVEGVYAEDPRKKF